MTLPPATRTFAHFALVAAFLLPYTAVNGWTFPLALPAVLGLAKILHPKRPLEFLGLRWRERDWTLASVILLVAGGAVHFAIPALLEQQGLHLDQTRWVGMLRLRPIFQVLSEEMAFRAVLLGSLLRWFRRGVWRLEWAVALVFGFGHAPFYWLKDGSILTGVTLINLTVMGWICNRAFISQRTIAIPFALHLAWNWTRFGADVAGFTGLLPEGRSFFALEGSPFVSLILGLSALLTWKLTRTRVADELSNRNRLKFDG